MEENDQTQAGPHMCRKGCGFYGSPNFDGFCSKCHRDMQEAGKLGNSVVGGFDDDILKSSMWTVSSSVKTYMDNSCLEL